MPHHNGDYPKRNLRSQEAAGDLKEEGKLLQALLVL